MTAITTGSSPRLGPPTARPLAPDLLRSEWTKLRSVRSTYWALLAAAAAMVGLAALLCAVYVNRYGHLSAAEKAGFHPVTFSLNGIFLAQLAIAVLGVLVVTAEYSTGSVRSTFVAVPQRKAVLAAKAAVFAGATFLVGLVSSFAAFFVGQAILSGKGDQRRHREPWRAARRRRRRAVPGGARSARPRPRGACPPRRRGHRGGGRPTVRPPGHRRRPALLLGQHDLALPSERRRPSDHGSISGRPDGTFPMGGIGGVLRLRRNSPYRCGDRSHATRRMRAKHLARLERNARMAALANQSAVTSEELRR